MPAIEVKDGPHAGERIELEEGEILLGRTSSEFLSHDDEVSRRHASLRRTAGGAEIEDLGSANGTFVNDRRIQEPTSLSSGDVVRLGRTSLEVEIEATEQRTVIREVTPPPAATPAPDTLAQPPVEAPATPPTFPPQPAAQAPPAAQPYPGAASAGASGISVAVAWIAFLAALLGVIWGIAVLIFVIQGEPDTSASWIVEIADLITTMVAVALAVAGGIAVLRGRRRGRLLVVLGGASGVVGPAINAIYYLPGSETINVVGWIGLAAMVLYAATVVLGLATWSKLVRE